MNTTEFIRDLFFPLPNCRNSFSISQAQSLIHINFEKRASHDERKRSHDEEETPFSNRDYSNTQSARYSKRPALTTDEYDDGRFNNVRALAFRCLVTTREAGIIIGKQGRSISSLREQSGARITISEMIPGAHERVLSVIGTPDSTSLQAFGLLAEHIPKESDLSDLAGRSDRLVNFRLLVPHGRMGSIIDRTGAKLHASEEMLPQSTERTLTITGYAHQIQSAVREVGLALKELPERTSSVIHFKPTASRGNIHNSPAPMFGGHGYGSSSGPSGDYGSGLGHGAYTYGYPGRAEFFAWRWLRNERYASRRLRSFKRNGRSTCRLYPSPADFIPNEMVGCIIGKGGTKINEMRMLSGAAIKVAESVNGSSERLVTITGTPDANRVALHLLYTRLEAEKSKILAAASGHGHR
ncbi:PAB1 binding protein [Massospora cicadina]|nr:PAB1 binding protein [Massospora cicadina]